MCTPTTCRTCSKTTWSGCGQHVDQVMRNVPKADRCACDETDRAPQSFLGRLFSRR